MRITEAWLKMNGATVLSAMDGPDRTRIVWVSVPPELCGKLYDKEYNSKNREMRNAASHLTKLSSDIRNGHFVFNGDTIRFSDEGLMDGQHRLKAHCDQEVPFKGVFVLGLEEETMTTMDIGKPRNLKQFLTMAKFPNVNMLAPAVRFMYGATGHPKGALSHSKNVSIDESMMIARNNPKLVERSKHVKNVLAASAKIGLPGGDILALYHIYCEKGMGERAESVLLSLRDRNEPRKNGAILSYLKIMTDNANNMRKLQQKAKTNLLIHAWVNAINGKSQSVPTLKSKMDVNAHIDNWTIADLNLDVETAQ